MKKNVQGLLLPAKGTVKERLMKIVKDLVIKGLPYAVALYPYLRSEESLWVGNYCLESAEDYLREAEKIKEENTKFTLKEAFGRSVADSVYAELQEKVRSLLVTVKRNREKCKRVRRAINDVIKVLEESTKEAIIQEVRRRLNVTPYRKEKALSIACFAIIFSLLTKREVLGIKVMEKRGIVVEFEQSSALAHTLSTVLTDNTADIVEKLFYEHLLGFRNTYLAKGDGGYKPVYRLTIYPFVIPVIIDLALKSMRYGDVVESITRVTLGEGSAYSTSDFLKRFCTESIFYKVLGGKDVGRSLGGVIKRFAGRVLSLHRNEKSNIIYSDLRSPKVLLDKVLNQLVVQGYIYAKYIGPPPKELPKECHGVNYSGDPWLNDRQRSGEIKIWLLASTRNKKLRKRRRKCWKHHIELNLVKLFSLIERCCAPEHSQVAGVRTTDEVKSI